MRFEVSAAAKIQIVFHVLGKDLCPEDGGPMFL
jgi:hypothetical protein